MTRQGMTIGLLTHLVFVAAVATAQEPSMPLAERFLDPRAGLSVDDAVRQALDHLPRLNAVRSDVEAMESRQQQAGLRSNPTVSLERREQPGGSDNQTMAQVQWPLDLFRRRPRVEVASREVEVRQRAAANAERVAAGDVRRLYGAAAAAVRDLALAERAVDLLARQFVLVDQRAQEGAVPPLERDQMEVELRRYEADRWLAVGRVKAAVVDLKRSIGASADAPLQLRDSLDLLVPPPREAAIAVVQSSEATRNRSDVALAEAEQRLAESRIGRAAAEGRFDVSLFGSYARMASGFPQRGVGPDGALAPIQGIFHYASAGATLTLPWRNRNQGEVAAVRAEAAGASFRVAEARLQAAAELTAADAREDAATRALAITERTVALAAKNLEVVRQAYELGRTTVSDVLAEQRRLLDVERGHTETLKAAYEAHVAVLLARGER
jgi:outer membrane protein, heavy metal efflux system